MKIPYVSAALVLALSACGGNEKNEAAYNNDSGAYAEGEGNVSAGAGNAGGNYSGGTATASRSWPEGARIIVENGVTYRVDPGGVRVALGPNDSRIVVEDGVRYRVDPGGTRVRINDEGLVVDIGDAPSVTVNTQ